jgi:hypothetical protein
MEGGVRILKQKIIRDGIGQVTSTKLVTAKS